MIQQKRPLIDRPKIPYYFKIFLQKQGIIQLKKIQNNELIRKTWTDQKIEQEQLIQKIYYTIIGKSNNKTSLQLCKEIDNSLDQIKKNLSIIALEEFLPKELKDMKYDQLSIKECINKHVQSIKSRPIEPPLEKEKE
jgi:hypothetical protein